MSVSPLSPSSTRHRSAVERQPRVRVLGDPAIGHEGFEFGVDGIQVKPPHACKHVGDTRPGLDLMQAGDNAGPNRGGLAAKRTPRKEAVSRPMAQRPATNPPPLSPAQPPPCKPPQISDT